MTEKNIKKEALKRTISQILISITILLGFSFYIAVITFLSTYFNNIWPSAIGFGLPLLFSLLSVMYLWNVEDVETEILIENNAKEINKMFQEHLKL